MSYHTDYYITVNQRYDLPLLSVDETVIEKIADTAKNPGDGWFDYEEDGVSLISFVHNTDDEYEKDRLVEAFEAAGYKVQISEDNGL